jgi:hypothetical protein
MGEGETNGASAVQHDRSERLRVSMSSTTSVCLFFGYVQLSVMLSGPHLALEGWTRWCRLSCQSRLHDLRLSQIQTAKGEVIVTNDGATILRSIQALHPAAKMASHLRFRAQTRS